MFSSTSGNVYRFIGEVADGENPIAVITEKFIGSAGVDLMSIVVVQTNNMFVLYTDLLETVTSTDFEFLTDLTPDPIIEQVAYQHLQIFKQILMASFRELSLK